LQDVTDTAVALTGMSPVIVTNEFVYVRVHGCVCMSMCETETENVHAIFSEQTNWESWHF